MALKFIALSGTTAVTENHYVYENDNDLIVVDCGVGFPEPEMLGIDLVIPDFSYLKKNKKRLRGVLISHGHEDHLGALPFLYKEIGKFPIHATKLVAGFIEGKFGDYGIKDLKVNVFDPERDVLSLGSFKVTPFRVSHSVPDGVGFAIDTPEGKIFHVADYKFDWTPVDGRPFDVQKAAILAADGCLAVASDCLGATSPGYTESERELEGRIERIVRGAKGQIFFTTISSNISRMQQAINVAHRLGRKVCFIGRSIDSKAEIAKNLGILKYDSGLVVNPKKAADYHKDRILYIISGSYGQPGSALYRVALGEHDFLQAEEGDTVIFSSDPAPPGSKANVDMLVDKFIESNIDVHYYDLQEDLHVSGHGSQEDIKFLFGLLSPKFFIPIGGTVRHMRAYQLLAQSFGARASDVFELQPGESIEFNEGKARRGKTEEVRNVLVDGLGVGDVGNILLRDRHILAKDGIAVVIIQFDPNKRKVLELPDIISRGFVFGDKMKGTLEQARRLLEAELTKHKSLETQMIRTTAIDFLEKFFYKKTGRRPMILPFVVEI